MARQYKTRTRGSVRTAFQDRRWSIDSRTNLQHFMFQVHDFLQTNPELQKYDLMRSIVALTVGASFALWRAACLIPGANRNWHSILGRAERFLLEVGDSQTISYASDRDMRDWTSGFYVNDAIYRI